MKRGRRGSMFELLGANLFRHPPQSVVPTPRNYPGYDLVLTMRDGGEADISLKSYGTSFHESTFREQAAKSERAFIQLLKDRQSEGGVLLAIANAYPSVGDWETLRSALRTLPSGQAIQHGIWAIKMAGLPADYAPYSPHHLSFQVFMTAPFHKNESKNLSDKFDEAFANAEEHALNKPDSVRVVLVRVPEAMSLQTCEKWAKDYLANNANSPIDGVYLYQLSVAELPNDQSVMSHAICVSETDLFRAWRSPPGRPRRVLALNLAVGAPTAPTHVEMRGGLASVPVHEAYHYQRAEYYTVYKVDPNRPTTAWIKNLASGIFQYAVLQFQDGQITLGGYFPPVKDVTLFD
jgi:hypothetical protein